MKRAHAIDYLRIAGYHADRAAFTRLYVENRVSYSAATEAYRAGQKARDAGVRCTCRDCNPNGERS